jgi:hypothetical protein
MLTATLPISVALLATTTIRLLFLLPGPMLSATLMSTALVLTALPPLGSAGLDCSGSCFPPVVLPRNKRLDRGAVPESSLRAISLRVTKKGANAVCNFGSGVGRTRDLS